MKPTLATFFSGGGLFTCGAIQAGYSPVFGCEWNPDKRIGPPDAIAAWYAENFGDKHLHVCPIADVPQAVLKSLDGVDLAQFSPPCIRASIANAQGGETDLDKELAAAIIRAIRLMRPRAIILENVQGYRAFDAYRMITDCLELLGYGWMDEVLNSADYGTAQTRRRLILRAYRDGRVPEAVRPTHDARPERFSLSLFDAPLLPWNGWYGAVADLLPGCPESPLAAWQMKRLPDELKNLLIQGIPDNYTEYAVTPMEEERDAPPLTATMNHHPLRAVFVTGTEMRDFCTREDSEPTWTLSASAGYKGPPRAVLITEQHSQPASDPNRQVQCIEEGRPAPTLTQQESGGMTRAILLDTLNATRIFTARDQQEPLETVLAGHLRRPQTAPRALLCHPNGEDGSFVRGEDQPAKTIVSDHGASHFRAIVPGVRTVSLTPRCLGRFQDLPDSYKLPEKKGLACTLIGNGVPCLLAKKLAESLLP